MTVTDLTEITVGESLIGEETYGYLSDGHLVIIAPPRQGKTNALRHIMSQVIWWRHAVIMLVDPQNQLLGAAPRASAIVRRRTDYPSFVDYLMRVLDTRQHLMDVMVQAGRLEDNSKWNPALLGPYLIVFIDELPRFTHALMAHRDGEKYEDFLDWLKTGLKLGCGCVTNTQKATKDVLGPGISDDLILRLVLKPPTMQFAANSLGIDDPKSEPQWVDLSNWPDNTWGVSSGFDTESEKGGYLRVKLPKAMSVPKLRGWSKLAVAGPPGVPGIYVPHPDELLLQPTDRPHGQKGVQSNVRW